VQRRYDMHAFWSLDASRETNKMCTLASGPYDILVHILFDAATKDGRSSWPEYPFCTCKIGRNTSAEFAISKVQAKQHRTSAIRIVYVPLGPFHPHQLSANSKEPVQTLADRRAGGSRSHRGGRSQGRP